MGQQNELTPVEEVLQDYMIEVVNLRIANAELRGEVRRLSNNENLVEEKRDSIEQGKKGN